MNKQINFIKRIRMVVKGGHWYEWTPNGEVDTPFVHHVFNKYNPHKPFVK